MNCWLPNFNVYVTTWENPNGRDTSLSFVGYIHRIRFYCFFFLQLNLCLESWPPWVHTTLSVLQPRGLFSEDHNWFFKNIFITLLFYPWRYFMLYFLVFIFQTYYLSFLFFSWCICWQTILNSGWLLEFSKSLRNPLNGRHHRGWGLDWKQLGPLKLIAVEVLGQPRASLDLIGPGS